MATRKRSSTFVTDAAQQTTPMKKPVLRRTSAVVMGPPAPKRVGALVPFIVVVGHQYPAEFELCMNGQARGMGNTFTVEVVAADDQDAVDTVGVMFGVDFEKTRTLNIVKVSPVPGVHYRDGLGRTASVLSSRHCAIHEGSGAFEEMSNAVRDAHIIESRDDDTREMTELETRVFESHCDVAQEVEWQPLPAPGTEEFKADHARVMKIIDGAEFPIRSDYVRTATGWCHVDDSC